MRRVEHIRPVRPVGAFLTPPTSGVSAGFTIEPSDFLGARHEFVSLSGG